MAKYVDGFVIPVPKNNLDEYKKIAEFAGSVWEEHGAFEYMDCVGDDLGANRVIFKKVTGAKDHETVIFSWIVFESREHRDKVNAAVMADPHLVKLNQTQTQTQPFDYKRMLYGGFKTLVEL